VPNVKKIRGLKLPGTPLGHLGLLWESFTFFLFFIYIEMFKKIGFYQNKYSDTGAHPVDMICCVMQEQNEYTSSMISYVSE
jgi:hypothetical protein